MTAIPDIAQSRLSIVQVEHSEDGIADAGMFCILARGRVETSAITQVICHTVVIELFDRKPQARERPA